MNLPVSVKQVIIIRRGVDFRKGFNGLLNEAYRMGSDPYLGDCIVFIKADRTQVRALTGDSRGLYLLSRRFESGQLPKRKSTAGESDVSSMSSLAELAMIFDGASFTVHNRVSPWR